MTITCPKCKAKLNLSEAKVKPEGARFRCPKCGTVLVYKAKARQEPPEKQKQTGGRLPKPLPAEQKVPDTESGPAPEEVPGLPPERRGTLPEKTGAASATDTFSSQTGAEVGKGIPGKALMAGSAAGVLVLLLVAVFVFRSPRTATVSKPAPVAPAVTETSAEPPAGVPSDESPPAAMEEPPPLPAFPEEMSSLTPEEKAIAMVKRSDVLLKMASVDSIVNKWTEDNAGKYKVVGWQTRKIDEQKYLVSYTAVDGSTPRGFYFVADLGNGGVEDLAHRPELQKKYNIEYAR